jgi:hypothetical protein
MLNFEATQGDTTLRTRIRAWIGRARNALADAVRTGQRDGSITSDCDPTVEAQEMIAVIIVSRTRGS